MLEKYLSQHTRHFDTALKEIQNGRKDSHWMWFIFPQIKGLGRSLASKYYALNSIQEAKCYMDHDVLQSHMLEICNTLLTLENNDITQIMGFPDNLKLKSCMTLFSMSNPEYDIFQKVLDKYYDGKPDDRTVAIIKQMIDKNKKEV